MQWYEYSKTEVCGVKPVPVPLSSPQIPQGLAWDWNHAHAARWQQLPAKVIAPLLCSMTDWNVEWHLLVTEAATQQRNKSDVLTATNAEWKKCYKMKSWIKLFLQNAYFSISKMNSWWNNNSTAACQCLWPLLITHFNSNVSTFPHPFQWKRTRPPFGFPDSQLHWALSFIKYKWQFSCLMKWESSSVI